MKQDKVGGLVIMNKNNIQRNVCQYCLQNNFRK